MKTYIDYKTGSGGPVPRGFCTKCGSGRSCSFPADRSFGSCGLLFCVTGIGFIPEEGSEVPVAFVWLGLFPRVPTPEIELFTAHRQVWTTPVEGAVQHEFLGDFMG